MPRGLRQPLQICRETFLLWCWRWGLSSHENILLRFCFNDTVELRNRDLADECQQVMWINVWTHMQLHSDIQLPVPIWLRPPGMKPLMYGLRGFRDQPSKYP